MSNKPNMRRWRDVRRIRRQTVKAASTVVIVDDPPGGKRP